jgi:hypothetical protein
MKTENLLMVLFMGGIVGFLGAISLRLVGVTPSHPYNATWLFFFISLGLYTLISAILMTAKIKFNCEILK